jgi:hypothetical protein
MTNYTLGQPGARGTWVLTRHETGKGPEELGMFNAPAAQAGDMANTLAGVDLVWATKDGVALEHATHLTAEAA